MFLTERVPNRKTECPGSIDGKSENSKGDPEHLERQTGKTRWMSEAESGGKDDTIFRLQIYTKYKCFKY